MILSPYRLMGKHFCLMLVTAYIGTAGVAPAQTQQLEQQTLNALSEGRPLDQLLERLSLEVRVLREVQQRIQEEGTRLRAETLAQLQDLSARVEEGESPLLMANDWETNSQLIRNCLTELQKIQWEEAAEEAYIGESQPSSARPDFDRERLKLHSEISVAQVDMTHLQKQLSQLKELYERKSVAEATFQEQRAKVARSEAVLHALHDQLKMLEESAQTASEAPVVAAKQRLAQLRARKRVALDQLKQLQTRQLSLEETRVKEQSLRRTLEEASRMLESEVPMRVRLIETEILLQNVEKELAQRKSPTEKR